MPNPKNVMAIGACALSGAPFKDCYNVLGGIDSVLPVDAYVPGCPPKPEAIIDGISKLIQMIKKGENHGKRKGNCREPKETPKRRSS